MTTKHEKSGIEAEKAEVEMIEEKTISSGSENPSIVNESLPNDAPTDWEASEEKKIV